MRSHWICRLLLVGRTFLLLIIPIHEHERAFHLLIPSLISSFKNLKLLSFRSFTSLVRVTSMMFYIICGYCKWCCFHDFWLSTSVIYIYLKATDFWVNLVFSHFAKDVGVPSQNFWGHLCIYLICKHMLNRYGESELLSWRGIGFCQRLFQHLMRWLRIFWLSVCSYVTLPA